MPVDESVRRLQHFLIENARRGCHAVIAVDEAQLLVESGTLETLRLLMNFETATEPALTLLLVGQGELLPALDRLPGLEARVGVKCLLRPLNLEETVSYVSHRMTAAGATHEIFTSQALNATARVDGGQPAANQPPVRFGAVDRLCRRAGADQRAADRGRVQRTGDDFAGLKSDTRGAT